MTNDEIRSQVRESYRNGVENGFDQWQDAHDLAVDLCQCCAYCEDIIHKNPAHFSVILEACTDILAEERKR